ncbi:MAG: hypothetical protein ABH875_07765 [Candidatus Omnitrophota bacterium]
MAAIRATFSIALLLATALIFGCSSDGKDGSVIATVNGEPIFLKDLQRELNMMVRQDPSLDVNRDIMLDLTDTLVKRKIMIQKATEKKMAEEPGFVDTIKAFWEQTLIRNFMEYKNTEFDRLVFVTDGEIEDYYNAMKKADPEMPPIEETRGRLSEMIKMKKISKLLEKWLEEEQRGSDIKINKGVVFEQAS